MFLKRLELTNFGGHEHLLVVDPGPVVGLLGPNGSGKSTVLYALEALLRGEVSLDKKDPMETFVRNWGSPDGANNAIVEGEWEDQGTRWVLTRQFGKTSKRLLKAIDGPKKGQEYTKADIVTKVLAEMFGADIQLSGPAVFLKQGSLHKMLFGTDAEREELFVKLLNVQHVVKNVEVVDDCRNKLMSGIQDLSQAIDDARVAWESAETERRNQSEIYAKIPDFSPDIQTLAELIEAKGHRDRADASSLVAISALKQAETVYAQQAAANNNQPWESIAKELEQSSAQAENYRQAIQQVVSDRLLRGQLQTAEKGRVELTKIISDSATGLEARQTLLGRMASALSLTTRITDLQNKIQVYPLWKSEKDALDALLASPFNEPEPLFYAGAAQRDMAEIDQELGVIKEAVKVLSTLADDVCNCTICGASKEHWTRSKKSSEELLITLSAKRGKLARDLQDRQDAHRTWKFTRDAYAQSLSTRQLNFEKLAAAVHPVDASFDVVKETAVLLELRSQLTKTTDLEAQVLSLTQGLSQQRAQLVSLQQQVEQLTLSLGNRLDHDLDSLQIMLRDLEASTESKRLVMQQLKMHADQVATRQIELNAKAQTSEAARVNEQTVSNRLSGTAKSFLDKYQGDGAEAIRELRERQQARDEAAGAFNSSARVAEENKCRLELLEQSRSRNAAKQTLGASLQTLRQVFTRQGLPMSYVNYRFRRLALVTSSYMQEIDNDMQVAVDDERSCAFKFRRHNSPEGLWFPQEKMSGGQRVRLCVAFSFAMQRLILPKLGFLTLDEPSTHLDEGYVPLLADLLASIGSKLKNTNSQIWVTDHHRELTRAFSNVITFRPLDEKIVVDSGDPPCEAPVLRAKRQPKGSKLA